MCYGRAYIFEMMIFTYKTFKWVSMDKLFKLSGPPFSPLEKDCNNTPTLLNCYEY